MFKSNKTTQKISNGFRTYYNFIKKHQGLNGLTPSQKANIELNLDRNRWLSLLKRSIENNGVENDLTLSDLIELALKKEMRKK